MAACSPTASQLQKTLEEHPEVLLETIKKHPKKFMDTLYQAQELAQKKAQDDQLEEEFKSPKTPEIQDNRVIFGNKNAPVTIVEYSDFQCPYCSKAHDTMKGLQEKYGEKVRIVYKHLPFKSLAEPAARYYEAIGMQDPAKAEKFHDTLYENQKKIHDEGEDYLKQVAKEVGADLKQVLKDMSSETVNKILKADFEEAQKFGFRGTPGFLVNGVAVNGAYPQEHFETIIDRHLNK